MKKNLKAFTLAEVLITLGIIGVVASLTIPLLTSSNNKRIAEGRLAKFYSTMSQVIQLSEIENGSIKNWDSISNFGHSCDWVDRYLKDYIKTLEIKRDGATCLVYYTDGSLLTTGDAMHFVFYPQAKDYGTEESIGKKSFLFYFNPSPTNTWGTDYTAKKGIEPYKFRWDGTENMLRNDSEYGCRTNGSGVYCAALIQYNGWKIPDDYPFKF